MSASALKHLHNQTIKQSLLFQLDVDGLQHILWFQYLVQLLFGEQAVLENQLKSAYEEDVDVTIGGYHIIIKTVESTRLDSKSLRIDLGDEVLDPYLSVTTSRRLIIN